MKNPPNGYGSVTAHLNIDGAGKAIDFYKRAFGAEEVGRAPSPDGRLLHAEIKIGDTRVMLSDVFPEYGGKPSRSTLHIYCDDADALWKRATDAGASVSMPLADMFWGDRYGTVEDPFGQRWAIATKLKEMTSAEMKKAQDEAMAKMKPPGA
jgi:uncharacterized glyoxalase superfamily protein PhnB